MKNFEGFGLSPALVKSLAHMKYETPTPIQAQAIPLALAGRDIMGTAQTGTGKTAAFAIPLIERLLTNPRGSALVLTPTRELGKQIMDIMHQLIGPKSPIRTAFIIGGEPMGKQLKQLRANPRLIVGTPGRINDHLERGNIKLHDADFLVLDETDRMLDMGFMVQLERIFKYMPETRQTLMFSATLPKNILKLSEQYMNNPERIAVGAVNVVAQNIKQEVIRIEQDKKYHELQMQLHDRNGSVIVFVKTKYGAEKMAKNLRRDGFTSEALHGDLRQNKRDKVMLNFRNKNFRVLIATDIAARGLDVPHIEHVVNYDLPQVAEDYIHRMGRTARAGAKGAAISFVASQDVRKWQAIEKLLNPDAANDKGNNRGTDLSNRPAKKGKPRRSNNAGGPKNFGNAKPSNGQKPWSGKKAEGKKPWSGKKNTDGQKPKQWDSKKKHDRDDQSGEQKEGQSQNRKPFNSKKKPSGQKQWVSKRKPDGQKKFSGPKKQGNNQKRFKGGSQKAA